MSRIHCLLLSLVILAVGQLLSINAHSVSFGSCPDVEPLKGFDIKQFLGEWFVIQRFGTSSSCMKLNFVEDDNDNGKLLMSQTREHALLDIIGFDKYTYSGYLRVSDVNEPAKMKIKFPLNVAYDFVVFDTDYKNYAGFFSCQDLLVGHWECANILSRKPTLDQGVVKQLRYKLSQQYVDVDDFAVVSQKDCKNTQIDDDAHLTIDAKTFSAKNIGEAVKTVGVVVAPIVKRGLL